MRLRGNQASMTVWEGEAWKSKVVLSAVIWPYFAPESDEAADGWAGMLEGVDEISTFANRLLEQLQPYDPEDNPTSQDLLRQRLQEMLDARSDS